MPCAQVWLSCEESMQPAPPGHPHSVVYLLLKLSAMCDVQLESELENLRGQGGDVSGHEKRLMEHKRHLADLENQHGMATK